MASSWVELRDVPYVIAAGAGQEIVGEAGPNEADEPLPPLQPFRKARTQMSPDRDESTRIVFNVSPG